MINIDPSQHSLQTILWNDSYEEEPKTYELQMVTYGTVSAPDASRDEGNLRSMKRQTFRKQHRYGENNSIWTMFLRCTYARRN